MITEREWQILRRRGGLSGLYSLSMLRAYWNLLLDRAPAETLTLAEAEEILQRLNEEA